jgi:hypothetical protein
MAKRKILARAGNLRCHPFRGQPVTSLSTKLSQLVEHKTYPSSYYFFYFSERHWMVPYMWHRRAYTRDGPWSVVYVQRSAGGRAGRRETGGARSLSSCLDQYSQHPSDLPTVRSTVQTLWKQSPPLDTTLSYSTASQTITARAALTSLVSSVW